MKKAPVSSKKKPRDAGKGKGPKKTSRKSTRAAKPKSSKAKSSPAVTSKKRPPPPKPTPHKRPREKPKEAKTKTPGRAPTRSGVAPRKPSKLRKGKGKPSTLKAKKPAAVKPVFRGPLIGWYTEFFQPRVEAAERQRVSRQQEEDRAREAARLMREEQKALEAVRAELEERERKLAEREAELEAQRAALAPAREAVTGGLGITPRTLREIVEDELEKREARRQAGEDIPAFHPDNPEDLDLAYEIAEAVDEQVGEVCTAFMSPESEGLAA